MPDLPTFTVNQSTSQRVLAAFSGKRDETTGEVMTPADAYRRWLKDRLITHVLDYEASLKEDDLDTQIGG